MKNNKLTICVGALAIFSLHLSNNAAIATPLDARFFNQNAFLYGDHIEVGIAPDGAFGSEVESPTGQKLGKLLGYISDPSKSNFNNGYHGDFFLPQVPEEGWGIYLNGTTYNNNRNQQSSGINGNIISTNKTNTTATAIWKSKASEEGKNQLDDLEVTQKFRIYKTGLAVIIDIELKNTTSSVMQNVYYMRTVDPDNNAQQNSGNNRYNTINTIMHQGSTDGGAAVIAKQSIIPQALNLVSRDIPSVLGLCGHGNNSRVAHGGTGNVNFPYYRNAKDVYENIQKVGDSKTDDSPIAIAFKFDNIYPGQTIKFRTGYQLADITPATIDINDSDTSGNNFTQTYELGTKAVHITDTDVSISAVENDLLVGASITIANAFLDDKLIIEGDLPNGISLDSDENNNDTEIYLTGEASKADYIQALQKITFENQTVTSHAESRKISIMVLDGNYTASTAATSIIEIIVPVTLNNDTIIQDNVFNASEASTLILTGTSAPNAAIEVVFTDKEGQKVAKTVTSKASGVWTLSTDPADISTLADGAMQIDITSTDDNGNKSSLTKALQKDTTVLLTITSPKKGETASSMIPIIEGKSDPDAKITITLSGTDYPATADSAGNWSITLPKQALGDSITFTVKAIDPVDNEAKLDGSNSITIKIPSIPLEVATVEKTTTPTFTGTSTPGTKITVTVPVPNGGTETCTTTTDADGNWSCQLPTLPSGGPYTAIIKTEDDKGNTSSITHEITIPELPLIIDSPADNSDISDSSPVVSGTSNPDTTVTVTASTGEKCIAITDSEGKWRCELPILPLNTSITLTAVTKDNANNTTTKTVDIRTPKLALKITGIDISTSPTFTGTSTPNANITVTVPMSETQSETCTTTVKADGSWSCKLPVLPSGGPYTATVKAEDSNGNYSTDTQVLSTPELPLSIDSHADNATIPHATPIIAGTSTAETTITLTASTGQTCTTTTNSKGEWSCEMPALPLDKTVTLTVKTEDGAGNTTTKHITLTTPTLPVSITDIASSTTPIMSGTSTPNTRITISIPINGSTTETCTTTTNENGNWLCQIPTLPTGGPYTAIVNAADNEGNTSSITQEFSVPELPLIIDSPTNKAVISGTTPTVSGTSLPDTKITVTASTGQSCTTTTESNNHWRCDLPSLALNSQYTVTVITEDTIGNSTTKSITLSTDKLPLSILSPGDKGTAGDSTPTFIGTSTPDTKITVTAETGQECQTTADENGNWTCELPEMPVGGPHSITIKAEDTDGNITTVTESITIPKIPLIIISPTKGETITDTSTLVTGTSDPSTPITVLGPDGERCTTTSDEKGDWRCKLDNLQSGDGKYITVISGDKGEGQKVSLVIVNIKNAGEKVSTILKGGGGNFSFFILFLMSLGLLLKQAIQQHRP
ncbi:MAG: hypothetical protein KAH00_02945 [Cocleimonas sp.]|nr:hypothetical protein [Cocleimonas sp.]